MRKTTPSLTALRAFEAAARHCSIARAAEELDVTPAAVSQQVAALEAQLGIALFDRVKQRLRLTPAGASYQIPVRASLDRIETATVDLLSHGGQRQITIGGLPSLTSAWLIPRLQRLFAAHPDLCLQIVTLGLNFASAERAPNLGGGQVDLAIYYGDGHWPGLVAEKLMSESLVAIGAPRPAGVARRNAMTASTLQSHTLLQHSTRPEAWAEWFVAQGMDVIRPSGPAFEHFYMLVDAVKAGLGTALVPQTFVQTELDAGVLDRVGSFELSSTRAYYVVFEPSKSDDPALATIRSWLHAEAADDAANDEVT